MSEQSTSVLRLNPEDIVHLDVLDDWFKENLRDKFKPDTPEAVAANTYSRIQILGLWIHLLLNQSEIGIVQEYSPEKKASLMRLAEIELGVLQAQQTLQWTNSKYLKGVANITRLYTDYGSAYLRIKKPGEHEGITPDYLYTEEERKYRIVRDCFFPSPPLQQPPGGSL